MFISKIQGRRTKYYLNFFKDFRQTVINYVALIIIFWILSEECVAVVVRLLISKPNYFQPCLFVSLVAQKICLKMCIATATDT